MVATDRREEEDVTVVLRGDDIDPNADAVQSRQLQDAINVINTEEGDMLLGHLISGESLL